MESSPKLIQFLNKVNIPYRKIDENNIDIEVRYMDTSLDPILVKVSNFNNH